MRVPSTWVASEALGPKESTWVEVQIAKTKALDHAHVLMLGTRRSVRERRLKRSSPGCETEPAECIRPVKKVFTREGVSGALGARGRGRVT